MRKKNGFIATPGSRLGLFGVRSSGINCIRRASGFSVLHVCMLIEAKNHAVYLTQRVNTDANRMTVEINCCRRHRRRHRPSFVAKMVPRRGKKGALLLLIPVLTYSYHDDRGTRGQIPPFALGVDSALFELFQKISFPFGWEKNPVNHVFFLYRSHGKFPVYWSFLKQNKSY